MCVIMVPARGNDPRPKVLQTFVQTIYTRLAFELVLEDGIEPPTFSV